MHRRPIARLFAIALTTGGCRVHAGTHTRRTHQPTLHSAASPTVAPGTHVGTPLTTPGPAAETAPSGGARGDGRIRRHRRREHRARRTSIWSVLTLNVVRPGEPVVERAALRLPWCTRRGAHGGSMTTRAMQNSFDILTGSVRLRRVDGSGGDRGRAPRSTRGTTWGVPCRGSASSCSTCSATEASRPRSVAPRQSGSPMELCCCPAASRPTPPHDDGVRHVTHHGFGELLDVVVQADEAEPCVSRFNYIVHGDLSGVEAERVVERRAVGPRRP